MEELTLLRQPPLTDQVLQILLERIKEGVYTPGNQLPPENELIAEFQISRATLRSAYAKLEERNLIQRRQGIGTFVSPQLNIANPLLEMIDFNDRITIQGFKPGFKQLNAQFVNPSLELSQVLEIDSQAETLQIKKVWTADDLPIIYIVNHIPLWVFGNDYSRDEILQPGYTEPFFQFFRHQCKKPIDYLTSCLTPEIVENCNLPGDFSSYAMNTPLLVIEDVGFSTQGIPVFHSLEHLLGPARKFETIRRVY